MTSPRRLHTAEVRGFESLIAHYQDPHQATHLAHHLIGSGDMVIVAREFGHLVADADGRHPTAWHNSVPTIPAAARVWWRGDFASDQA
jgi:hypothetical protein